MKINNPIDDFIAPKCHDHIEILYEDDDILVIEKPSGLLSLSGKNPLNFDSVHYRIQKDYPSALMCHRLDFGTSGVMVIALNKDAIAHLNRQFELKSIKKTYEAVLIGHVKEKSGKVIFPIAKAEFPLQKVCVENGKYCESHFEVQQRLDSSMYGFDATQVIFTPKTGRTHQLRVHAKAMGHSILGDDLYGTKQGCEASKRLMLNAKSIEFAHPTQSRRMHFDAKSIF